MIDSVVKGMSRKALEEVILAERLRCAAAMCIGCEKHGKPAFKDGAWRHPKYEVLLDFGDTIIQEGCEAEAIWEIT